MAVGLFMLMVNSITHASVKENDILYNDPSLNFVRDGTPEPVDEYIKRLMAESNRKMADPDSVIVANGPWIKSSGGGNFRNR